MKIHFVILITLIFSTSSYNQGLTFAPIGAVWTFEVIYFANDSIDYRQWISANDTLIGGRICRVIQRQGSYIASDLADKIIVYEDNNIVYWYNSTIDEFTVLYDFNKNTGENWIIKTDTCDLLIKVDSTGLEIINGYSLKTLYISSSYASFYGKVYQHIGSIRQPSPDINYICYGRWIDENFYHGLRCYEDSVFGFHDFRIAQYCNSIVTSNKEGNTKPKLKIFPNPFCCGTTLQTDEYLQNASIVVTNIYGQVVRDGIHYSGNTGTFLRGTLLKGIYYILIRQGNITIARDKILVSDEH